MARVTVVGAGVVGLTCAVRLLEDGHRVDVLARDLPLETTSAVAAAIWYPYRAFPFDRVLAWSARSYDVFVGLADVAGAGVALRGGVEVFATPQEDPWWRPAVPRLDHVAPPAGYADAWTFLAPVVEMPVYLAWLTSRIDELGGTITRLNLPALPVGRRRGRQRGRDRRATAGRGPVGRARCAARSCTSSRSASSSGGSTRPPTSPTSYPASHDIVVGGTDQEGDWSRTPSPSDRRADPGARAAAGARPGRGARAAAPGGPAARAPVGPGRARRRRRALLRPRRRRGHLELGHRGRGGGARRPSLESRIARR